MSERTASSPPPFWMADDDPAPRGWCQTLVDAIDGGVVQLDQSSRIRSVDETVLELTGYDREALVGEHVSSILPADAATRLEAWLSDPVDTDGDDRRPATVSLEVGLDTADDESDPRTLEVMPVESDDECRGAIGVLEPASQGSVAETDGRSTDEIGSLEGSETVDRTGSPGQIDSSGDQTPDGTAFEAATTVLEGADVGVFVLDDDFDVAWINEATERYFGIDREAVLGCDKRELIRETIWDRLADPNRFHETVTATYDDNNYVEQFECHVTPGDDRDERWLEHRSKPIADGPYAGGRVELYYDVTEQHDRAVQLRQLNESLREWLTMNARDDVAHAASRDIQSILDLEINGIYLYDPDTEALRPAGWTDTADDLFDEFPVFTEGEGIAWRVFETGDPVIYDDVRTDPDVYNRETPIRSEICLPIGDHGVVLVGSQRPEAFDETDRSLATVVASSLEVLFDRLHHERVRERERAQTEQLFQTAPVAIAVENAAGETVVSNRRTRELLGVSDGLPLGKAGVIDGWTVYDADGDALAPADAPVTRARRQGAEITDQELVLESPSGDRTWLSVNAAPVREADGTVDRVISVAEDVTERKRHERELERRTDELETELSEILGRVSDAFYALDEEWRFTHVNDRAAELLAHSSEALVGEVVWEVFPEWRESALFDRFHEAMDRQQAVSVDRYAPELDIWTEVHVYPSPSGLSVYFRDITERKRREQRLVQYEEIIETVEDGIYVLDSDGRFTLVNEAYADLTGYDREELIGTHASSITSEATVERARQIATDVDDVSTIETTLETNDGERVPVEATVTSLTRAAHGDERVGIVRDVTERRQHQRRLEASEQRYRTLAENFPDGIVALYDDDLRYTAAGGQLVDDLGIDRDVAIGQTIYDRYPEALLTEIEPQFRAALEGEERSFEVTYRNRELRAHTLPVETPGDDSTGMLVAQDVTERAAYERRLEASNERLEQFAYAVSHDLQEPLRMVTSYLGLVEQRYDDELDEDGREFIEFAVDGAERMRSMIDGLLEYSRVESRGEAFEQVDLDEVLASVCKDLEIQIEESNADVAVDSLPTVWGDRSQLRQVFQNLLANAVDYSGEEPPAITVAAERRQDDGSTGPSSSASGVRPGRAAGRDVESGGNGDGDEWIVSVTDEGIGIEPGDTDRIFDIFERLQAHDDGDGTGIGLALCRRIVERHGGEIWVDSEPGVGSTFSVALPAADP